jgi:hypothetical protein
MGCLGGQDSLEFQTQQSIPDMARVFDAGQRFQVSFELKRRGRERGEFGLIQGLIFLNIRYADSSVAPICIFSFEFDRQNPGKRRFVASTYHAFFAKYYEMAPEHQVFYELIREETPCRLYFE